MTLSKSLFVIIAFLFVGVSCVDLDFDEPPALGINPDIEANTLISDLKKFFDGNTAAEITSDFIISGIVTADDKSGNFYKTIYLQDETGGIAIVVDKTDYYNDYPIGRRIFVKCKGLFLGDYNGTIQLGGSKDPDFADGVERIPNSLISQFIEKGQWGQEVPIEKVVTIGSLNDDHISRLIELVNVTIVDAGDTYAIPGGDGTQNRDINDCLGGQITMRNSDFSNFAGQIMPEGP